jgi:serine-type D-Ala-D-Ala carboxypeptidase (penicillin-binding protein 5/6)
LTEPTQPEADEPGQANLYEVPVMVAPFRLDSLLSTDQEQEVVPPTTSPPSSAPPADDPPPRTRARHAAGKSGRTPPLELEVAWGAVADAVAAAEAVADAVVDAVVDAPAPDVAAAAPDLSSDPAIVWMPEATPPISISSSPIPASRAERTRAERAPAPHPRRERRDHRRRLGTRSTAIIVLVVVLLLAGLVAFRLHSPVPNAVVTADITPSLTVDTPAVSLPWPTVGEAAVSIPAIGVDMPSAPETTVPVASLTKLMTAYIILRDHPLRLGQNGPTVTISQADMDDYDTDTNSDESNAQVALGEQISEKDLLGGMLVHSANNYASALARWDAGSVAAFVAKMNQTATTLGMDHTHYADPTGYDQNSESTPEDLLKVAAPDMTNPVFAGFVKMSSITLPIAGTISTYTPLLGTQGVIGVKSGFTTVAGGCDVLAVYRVVHGQKVLVITAVTGQTGPNVLDEAGLQALNLANATATVAGESTVVEPGEVAAHVSAAGDTDTAAAASGTSMLSWPGVVAHRHFVRGGTIHQGAKRGTVVGSLVVRLGQQHQVIPVRLTHDLSKESILGRIL